MNIKQTFDMTEISGQFHKLIGVTQVLVDEDDFVYVQVKMEEKHTNPIGIAHGGFLFTLCDVAAGARMAYIKQNSVTLDSNINYYKPGKVGDTLTAKVIPRREGRNTSIYLVEVRNQDDVLLVDMMATMFHID
ncbi:PaaI family thioesterase [Globicatella sulfidifaciens]|uniref:Acyl-CoA thioesterase n=2 Tax=Globicatella sulfidifaciens TaxID=136093 RepID=A0A1T4JM27_9LACT|nr:PaaI family thioesterase [Globicatella sulfidifaciens]MDT2768003.1 PaaI family thioesterase [Globicatella sulfidifaciens]NLJ18003.1 PaaI family thioesterase [Globicatella sulfidifaciens]SJZ31203.1 acyl-CoA thioesterase [Globicatella sulfidifaciens DSM 15739]